MYCGHSPTCINMKRSLLTGSSPSMNLLRVCITTSPAGKRPISQQPIASGRLHHTAQTTGANRAAFVWHNDVPLCFFSVGQHFFFIKFLFITQIEMSIMSW